MQQLSRRCVTAADEVWRLQRSDDPEAQFFQSAADNGHYRREGATRQGIYMIATDGRLLASVNSLDPAAVQATIRDGLAAWDALDDSDKSVAPGARFAARSRWEDAYPEGGLVLRETIRALPQAAGEDRVTRYNVDHVWVDAGEVDSALPASLVVGDEVEWPALAERLGRFHLVDNAMGQTLPYAPEELTEAQLTLRVRTVEGGKALFNVTGRTAADADGVWRLGDNDWMPRARWPRKMTARLLGTACFDLASRRFEAFDLVGVGEWTGRTRFNGRGSEEPCEGRIGFVFNLAPDTPDERVAPAFVDIYDMEIDNTPGHPDQ